MQGEGGEAACDGVRRRSEVEEEETRGTPRNVELHVGRWDLHWGWGKDGRGKICKWSERVPWQTGDVDGEDLKLEVTIIDKDYRERMREEATEEVVPIKIFRRKQDVEEHGHTVRCPGCVSILRGTARQEHSADCRRRLERELGMTERAKKAKKKVGEHVVKKMEDDEDTRRKRREEKAKEDPMEEEAVGVAGKRKMDGEDDDGEEERVRVRGSNEEAGQSEVGW